MDDIIKIGIIICNRYHTCAGGKCLRSLRNREGSPVDLELNVAPIKNDDGKDVGTIWLGRDVTQLKATRTQLLQAKKLSTIDEVISGVAHELTNPLHGLLGFSELLLLREGSAPDRKELEMIHDAALRCRKIVENLLSFTRESKPARELHDINAVIEKTLEMKRYRLNASGIEIECDLDRCPDLVGVHVAVPEPIARSHAPASGRAAPAPTAAPARRAVEAGWESSAARPSLP